LIASAMRPDLLGLYGALAFCVRFAGAARFLSLLKDAPETDLREQWQAAPRHIPPFMGVGRGHYVSQFSRSRMGQQEPLARRELRLAGEETAKLLAARQH